MTMADETLLAQAAIDGELDAAGMLDFEHRLAGNDALAAEYGRLKILREVMQRELVKPVAPQALRDRIAAMAAPPVSASGGPFGAGLAGHGGNRRPRGGARQRRDLACSAPLRSRDSICQAR